MGYTQINDLVLFEFKDGTVIQFSVPDDVGYGATEIFKGIRSDWITRGSIPPSRPIRILLVRPKDLEDSLKRAKQCIHPHYQDNIIVIGSATKK